MKELPKPPGLVGEICEWIDATARKKQPLLSLAATLSYCGALMGRKVQTEWDLRTNLYTMGVAPSCSGKEHARTQLNKLTTEAGWQDLIGGEDVTSDAAIEMELHQFKTIFYLWDEIGHMMGNIKASGGAGHTAKIVPMLMKMYTSANKTYGGKSYANREEGKRKIDQPHCCVYGTTVPGRLFDGMDSAELLDGWLGRVLVFRTDDADPPTNWEYSKTRAVPQNLAKQVKWWANYQPALDTSRGDIVAATSTQPTVVPMTPDAVEFFKAMDAMATDERKQARAEGFGVDNLWGRTVENAQKVAMIIACGKGEPFIIDEECAECAGQIIISITQAFIKDIRDNVGDNDNDRNRKKVLKVIAKCGEYGLSKSDLTRKTQWLNKQTRTNLVDELLDAEMIAACEMHDGKQGYLAL